MIWCLVHIQTVLEYAAQDSSDHHYFEVLRYAADVGNAWFRGMYKYGVWLPATYAAGLIPLGWGLTES